jgi:CBS domain containing-hemolysin-like protein
MAQDPPSPRPWLRRALRVGLFSFLLAATVSYASSETLKVVPIYVAVLVLLVLIGFGVAFDILGTSVTAAEKSPLNAMAAKRIPGSRQALWLVRNADRVANFANDIVGDVTGAVSGAAGTTVALQLTRLVDGTEITTRLAVLGVVGMIAALTVGGKAAGKTFALTHATDVVVFTGRILYTWERITGHSFTGGRGNSASRRRTT